MLRGPEARSLQPKQNGISVNDAKNRIQAERAQLYDKLSKIESSVDPYLHLFSVSPKEKKKKFVVATSICRCFCTWSMDNLLTIILATGSKLSVADASSKLMVEQFPELRVSNNIHFSALSSKASRRFSVNDTIPPPLKSLAESKLKDRIRRNVLFVAITGISLSADNLESNTHPRRRTLKNTSGLPDTMKDLLHERSLK